MPKTIAFIPVRGGSKSIPLKNIKLFCGKPLVYWTAKAASSVEEIDQVIIATDSKEIKDVVQKFDLPKLKIYNRSSENAQDGSSTESVMLEYIRMNTLEPLDTFILIQATSPLLTSDDLRRGMKQKVPGGSVLSVVRNKRFFWSENGKSLNYDYRNRPRRQDFPGTLMENGAFYINDVAGILDDKNRLSGKIVTSVMPEYTGLEIDEPNDWFYMEYLMKKYILKTPENLKIRLVLSDVDGVLTDGGMYYSVNGDELKRFNTRDGMGVQLLRESGIKTGIITSEDTPIVKRRADKLMVDFLVQGKVNGGKLYSAQSICSELGITLKNVAYIGDDLNCLSLLGSVGFAACPSDAVKEVRQIPGIHILNSRGGGGAFREFAEIILAHNGRF